MEHRVTTGNPQTVHTDGILLTRYGELAVDVLSPSYSQSHSHVEAWTDSMIEYD